MSARRGNEVMYACQQDPLSWGSISSHCMPLHLVFWKSIFAIAEKLKISQKGRKSEQSFGAVASLLRALVLFILDVPGIH